MTENINIKKPGKTLLVKDESYDLSKLSKAVKTTVASQNIKFVEFTNTSDAVEAYNTLTKDNVHVKFAYYRVFIKFNTNINGLEYDDIKASMSNKLKDEHKDINILYFKLYRKDNKFIGSGELTIDNFDIFQQLIKKSFIYETSVKETKINYQLFRFKKKQSNSADRYVNIMKC